MQTAAIAIACSARISRADGWAVAGAAAGHGHTAAHLLNGKVDACASTITLAISSVASYVPFLDASGWGKRAGKRVVDLRIESLRTLAHFRSASFGACREAFIGTVFPDNMKSAAVMSPERLRQLEELFHAAREAASGDRAALLQQADPELRHEVESLLAHALGSAFLDRPAIENAPHLLENSAASQLAGQTVSHYKIIAMLGAGGMGVVYKAFDERLHRHVALKFLPTHLRHDQELKRRLKEEARAASTLNDPHIVVIHAIDETAEGDLFIAMAFHEGITLRDKIRAASGGLPVTCALQLTRQIASGLAKAHESGILHRDIKPANVIVSDDGVARIIDFGLAKSSQDTMTLDGSAKGTPLYMSPEQALGRPADFRTDLWSLGVVLYEMLAGQPPFRGESQLQVMRAVIDDQPASLRRANPGVSPAIESIVFRALQKDPANRYQSAGDMVHDLSAVLAGLEPQSSHGSLVLATPTGRRRWLYTAAALATLLATAGVIWRFAVRGQPVTPASEYIQLTNFSDSATAPALSPDGRMVTFFRGGSYFGGDGQIYVKMLPDGEARQLTNDSNVKYDPVFSPDGSRVAYTQFFVASRSFVTSTVPVFGGPPSILMANAAGLSWISPGQVLFSEIMPGTVAHMGIVTAQESRAGERVIYFPTHERAMAHYSWLSPDRNWVLLVEMDSAQVWQRCRVVPMDGKLAGTQVGPEGGCTAAGWSPDGQWMYLNVTVGSSSHLWRQGWHNGSPDGKPTQITFGPTEEEGLAVAPDGKSLIAAVGTRQSSVWTHDAAGDHMVSQEGAASAPSLSADGKRLYYLLQKNNQSNTRDLWLRDLDSGTSRPLLPGLPVVDYAVSPDETQVALTAAVGNERQIFLAVADRSAPPRLMVRGGDTVSFGAGGQLVFRQLSGKANYLARIRADGTGLQRISNVSILEKLGASPDGRLVLATGVGGTRGMFAVSMNGRVGRRICTTRCEANWTADQKYLYLTVGGTAKSNGRTFILPIPPGGELPDGPPIDDAGPAGARVIPHLSVAPGPNPETYGFAKSEFKGNLFRIPLH